MTRAERATFWNLRELRERGWYPAMVRDSLGDPDLVAPVPGYPSQHQNLYRADRVEAAEGRADFAALRERSLVRSAAGDIAAETIRTRMRAAMRRDLGITLPDITADELLARAEAAADTQARSHGRKRGDRFAPWGQADAARDRACLAYLRHECTPYDYLLDANRRKQGRWAAREEAHRAVEQAAAGRWPQLAAARDDAAAQQAAALAAVAMLAR